MAARRDKSASAPAHPSSRASNDYFALSVRPLYCFFFLGALVVAYELGTLLYLTDQHEGIQHTVRARRLLDLFFANFGVAGFMATGLAMLTVLLVWHVLSRNPWTIRPIVLAGMALEASLWALPLVVFGAIFQRAGQTLLGLGALGFAGAGDSAGVGGIDLSAGADLAATCHASLLPLLAADPQKLLDLSWQARVTIAIGAGIYEEMLFRLIGLAAIHFVAKDLLQAKELTARIISVAVTASAFAAYHDVAAYPKPEQMIAVAFYTAAGIYFGVIYLTRGFGIVVATHAVYDVLALVILAPKH